MNISAAKSYAMIVLFVMLIVFSILGFTAMKPQSTQKNIDAFWISVIAFLLLLAAYIFFSSLRCSRSRLFSRFVSS